LRDGSGSGGFVRGARPDAAPPGIVLELREPARGGSDAHGPATIGAGAGRLGGIVMPCVDVDAAESPRARSACKEADTGASARDGSVAAGESWVEGYDCAYPCLKMSCAAVDAAGMACVRSSCDQSERRVKSAIALPGKLRDSSSSKVVNLAARRPRTRDPFSHLDAHRCNQREVSYMICLLLAGAGLG
jgi:hypothetical protein